MSSRTIRQASVLRHSALALALAIGLGGTGAVLAQSTTGNIFGTAQQGDTVQISGSTGITREVAVDSQGRYVISAFNGADSIAADNDINISSSVWRLKFGVSYEF